MDRSAQTFMFLWFTENVCLGKNYQFPQISQLAIKNKEL